MYCLTRNNMKFGDYFIPARTIAKVINKPEYKAANIHGLHLHIAISLFNMAPEESRIAGIPVSQTRINNELDPKSLSETTSQMFGITLSTIGTEVFLDAGDNFYKDAGISKWQAEKIFPNGIPNQIEKPPYENNKYFLRDIIGYLDNEFAEWVKDNCGFYELSEEDIENGEGLSGSEEGDKILTVHGLEQFEEKRTEYQNRLEVIGFTYNFKGGLIFD